MNLSQVIDPLMKRLESVEKGLARHAQSIDASGTSDERENRIVKALMRQGGKGFGYVGHDGACTTAGVVSALSGGRQKSM